MAVLQNAFTQNREIFMSTKFRIFISRVQILSDTGDPVMLWMVPPISGPLGLCTAATDGPLGPSIAQQVFLGPSVAPQCVRPWHNQSPYKIKISH